MESLLQKLLADVVLLKEKRQTMATATEKEMELKLKRVSKLDAQIEELQRQRPIKANESKEAILAASKSKISAIEVEAGEEVYRFERELVVRL